jgi:dinuclear metal center YbgI/SA1388 family protein
MAKRDAIVEYLNKYLESDKIKDGSRNGLQVEGKEEVKKIVLGVSASAELFRLAAGEAADMVIVHHGMIWDNPNRITGTFYKRVKLLLDNDISLAAWHLPLDMHPVDGHNARLIRFFGATGITSFCDYHGQLIGFKGTLKKPVTLHEACDILGDNIGGEPVAFGFGPKMIRTIGVVSGGSSGMVLSGECDGLDLYIAGDCAEPVQEYCREAGLNFISGGHYNTEKPGILALKDLLAKKFGVRTVFIDVPNRF